MKKRHKGEKFLASNTVEDKKWLGKTWGKVTVYPKEESSNETDGYVPFAVLYADCHFFRYLFVWYFKITLKYCLYLTLV